jgi:predicted O-methyltransferase YrrM
MPFPPDLETAIDSAWAKARDVAGYIGDREFRALGMLMSGAPKTGVTVEIGSYKGKSTVGLAVLSRHYGLGPVVSIDPHNAPSVTDPMLGDEGSSYNDFLSALRNAGVEDQVESHRAVSSAVARDWRRPIRFLWIDGDHTYSGAKLDFELFTPHLVDGAIVAVHDVLHEFEGPIRIFVEQMLRSDRFGPAGLLHSIGWAQYRPRDGASFRRNKERLARRAARLIPLVEGGRSVKGFSKMRWKLQCALIPHPILSPAEWEKAVAVNG